MLFSLARLEKENNKMHTWHRDVSREFWVSSARDQGLTFYADCTPPALYSCAGLYRARDARWRRWLCSLRCRDFRSTNDQQRGRREPDDSLVNVRVYTRYTRDVLYPRTRADTPRRPLTRTDTRRGRNTRRGDVTRLMTASPLLHSGASSRPGRAMTRRARAPERWPTYGDVAVRVEFTSDWKHRGGLQCVVYDAAVRGNSEVVCVIAAGQRDVTG